MTLENEYVSTSGHNSTLITAFITLQMFGWMGSSIVLLCVVCSRKIQRHATWINLCVTWILSGVSYSLLFLGHQLKDPPYHPLCLTQAALIYASPPLTAGATIALAIHLLFSVWSVYTFPHTGAQLHGTSSIILIILPYIPYLGVFIWVLVMGLQNPNAVIRDNSGMYCSMRFPSPGRFSSMFVAVTMVATVSIEGFIVAALYHNWRAYKHNNNGLLAMIIRVLCFSLFTALAVGISLVFVWYPNSASVPNIILALYPAAFVIIFSTQKDLLGLVTGRIHRQGDYSLAPAVKGQSMDKGITRFLNTDQ